MKLIGLAVAAVGAAMAGIVGCTAVVIGATTGAALPSSASATAVSDIPAQLLPVYQSAAKTCSMPWQILAAVGKVESDHGRSVALGVSSGTTNQAGARGPLQFLDGTWRAYGVDANGDGRADVYEPVDAIWGAANYLCANGAGNADTLRSAIWTYNHADWYVDEVLRIASTYAPAPDSVNEHALPLDRAVFEQHPDYLSAPHHDYPAIDIPVPVGSNVYAVVDGTVALVAPNAGICGGTIVINGDDGARYTYCHLSQELVGSGQSVIPGGFIARSGGQPGGDGSGDSTGPHLHLGVSVAGKNVCPQLMLSAWFVGARAEPSAAPLAGCTS